ncbi:hypothetical protein ACWT_4629 [Actinoplanes sp. SE50]|uniref:hypothetical protein n=1 Tax=unclassified Actinoplanes TaxID=2626549 RepID=UPI00023ED635|nr:MULTISPECIES: hypothetical protein [unclassified Actinoplanes]AEV85651.1 hypothetical protein ACPL_4760 [Actinoplanes sp. SE50/110]ATO84044.1 hypothetical protein ACWT_4629 [Actinoplanes sp. SE50]SLM01454.1 hypothetical protein ACSP50_4690 [Actinoplanes sp. SE50/110]
MSDRLEAHYRRLMWAYPRDYRERHGVEVITTLLDMAADERHRPSPGQALHLILCGLRQRFRLPARRPLALAGALLAAVIVGGFGGVAGTWLGWRTAAGIPAEAALRSLNTAMIGTSTPAEVHPEESAMKGPGVALITHGGRDYSPGRIRAALTAAGWRTTAYREFPVGEHEHLFTFAATRGRLKLDGSGLVVDSAEGAFQNSYRTDVWPVEPAVVRPLTVAGMAGGAVVGWLVAAALAYRVRRGTRARRLLASGSSAVALSAAAVPAFVHGCATCQVLVYAEGSPVPYITYGPGDGIPAWPGTIVALIALAAALGVTWRRRGAAASVAGPAGMEEAAG